MEQVIERICPSCESIIYEEEYSWASCFDCGLFLDIESRWACCLDCLSPLGDIDSNGIPVGKLLSCQSDECK